MTVPAESFLRAIVADPDSDTPRLVFADWLEEHGDPRGEFIRVQCELARLEKGSPEWMQRIQRDRELRSQHRDEWLGPLTQVNLHGGARFTFSRGLIHEVSLSPQRLLNQEARQILEQRLPIFGCNRLRLWETTSASVFRALIDCSLLEWFPEIAWLDSFMTDADLARLAASPHLAKLYRLRLHRPRLSSKGLETLADANLLPNLHEILFQWCSHQNCFAASDVGRLLACRPNLEAICMEDMEDFQLAEFLESASTSLQQLHRLRLGGSCHGLIALARCEQLANLKELILDGSSPQLSDEILLAMLENPAFERLKTFTIRESGRSSRISLKVFRQIRARFPFGSPQLPKRN